MKHINPRTGQRMECDRQIIGECIRVWFGSVAEFDAFVQQGPHGRKHDMRWYGFVQIPVCQGFFRHKSDLDGTVAFWVAAGVAAAFNQNLGMYGFPYRWILAGTVPVYWWGLLSYVGSTYTPGDWAYVEDDIALEKCQPHLRERDS